MPITIDLNDLTMLLDYINTQSVWITSDYRCEMEDHMGETEVENIDKLLTKFAALIAASDAEQV